MMFVLGCFPLPLLLRLGWVPRSLLPLGIACPVSVNLLSALGGATLLGSGITSAGLAVVALPMLLVSLLARFLLASDGLFPLITLTRLRSLRSVAG